MEPADELFGDNLTNAKNGIPVFKTPLLPSKTANGTVVDESNSPHHYARHVADYPFFGSSIFYCLCRLCYKL